MRSEGKKNVYEGIVSEWKALIESGALKEGEKLPSVRIYAMERKVNPNTVAKAYAALEADGYIVVQLKKGAYVCKRTGQARCFKEEIVAQIRQWKEEGVTQAEIERTTREIFEAEQSKGDGV